MWGGYISYWFSYTTPQWRFRELALRVAYSYLWGEKAYAGNVRAPACPRRHPRKGAGLTEIARKPADEYG